MVGKALGTVFGEGYRIVRYLGERDFGDIYLASEPKFDSSPGSCHLNCYSHNRERRRDRVSVPTANWQLELNRSLSNIHLDNAILLRFQFR